MKPSSESIVVRLLRWLAGAVYEYPMWFVIPQLLLFAAGVFYTVATLQFITDRNELVGREMRHHQLFIEFREEFPAQDDMVVVVESEALEKNRQFVERLGAKLEQETELFADIFYKGDLRMMGPKALLFVAEEDLKELHRTLQEFRPFLHHFSQATNLTSFFNIINTQFRRADRDEGDEGEALVQALPALQRIVVQGMDSLRRRGSPPSPGVNALFGAGEEAEREMYVTFGNGRIYLVTAKAAREELNAPALARLRELIAQTQQEVPGLNVGVTGETVLELDEMVQAQLDMTRASIVALVLCSLIFIFGYQETRRPLMAILCLLFGLGYTMAFTTLVIGHLNILTITFMPILIGLSIDFGVHLITRYEEELLLGHSNREAIEKAMVNTGAGIFTGAFTTSGAFFAMALTNFRGVREMGIISGGGMLLCLIPMMTLLPVMLVRLRKQRKERPAGLKLSRRARLERVWLQRPGLTAGVTVVLALVAILYLRQIYFDYNLLNMQSRDLPAVVHQERLIETAGKSVLFAAVVADTLEEAARLEKALEALPSVAGIDSMARFLMQDHAAKLEWVERIKEEIQNLEFAEPDSGPVNVSDLNRTLWALQGYLGLATSRTVDEFPELAEELRLLRRTLGEFRKEMLAGNSPRLARLNAYQRSLFEDIRETFQTIRLQDTTGALRIEDLPQPLRNRFVGQTGKYLLQVYPEEDIWERLPQAEFVRQLRSIHPDVTGTPVQLLEYTTLLKDSYIQAAWYAFGAIVILVFVHFRSVSAVLLALTPVGLGMIWMVGLMGGTDIPFNPANIMTLPLVIGIGVTNGIHILNRFKEEGNPAILARSTGKAVLVSGLTTIAGFGSLLLAKHQGIASLGAMMSLGVTTCMIAGLIFLPCLLTILQQRGWSMQK